jgi:hypothetical protein
MVALAIWMVGFLAVMVFERYVVWKITGKDNEKHDSFAAFYWITTAIFLIVAIFE